MGPKFSFSFIGPNDYCYSALCALHKKTLKTKSRKLLIGLSSAASQVSQLQVSLPFTNCQLSPSHPSLRDLFRIARFHKGGSGEEEKSQKECEVVRQDSIRPETVSARTYISQFCFSNPKDPPHAHTDKRDPQDDANSQ